MSGLEAVEVGLRDLLKKASTFRLDSDFYKKDYLKAEMIIKRNRSKFLLFSEMGLTVGASAFYPSLQPYYNTGDVPFIRVADVGNYIDYKNCVKIPYMSDDFKTLKLCNKGDIVLTKGGTIGLSGLIERESYVTRDLIFINSSILCETDYTILYLLFSTNFMYKQMIKSSSYSVQPHLTITLIKELLIYQFTDSFKKRIFEIYSMAKRMNEQCKILYNNDQEHLLTELGFLKDTLSNKNVSIKTFSSSFGASGRLDAEYYHPKYDELKVKIKTNSKYYKRIKEIQVENFRGLQPVYIKDGELDVINSKHILEDHLDYDNFEKTNLSYWTIQSKARVFKEDILIYTTGANIGRTNIYLKDDKALASNHVNILRVNNENPYYIAFVLNSLIGRMQTEKLSVGSAQQELYPKDIENFIIPFIDDTTQDEISNNMIESFNLHKKSSELLEYVKQALEIAIQKDEYIAIKWLEEKING